MGRGSWATPDQLTYLKSFIPGLQRAKETTGLKTLYQSVYNGFLETWAAEPYPPHKYPEDTTPEQCVVRAKKRLRKRITNWYKQVRKRQKYSAHPYAKPVTSLLDLSGKSARKRPPYQLHQAYSIIYWKPEGSPLRDEVKDLWLRRNEDSVRGMLNPFIKEAVGVSTSTSQKLVFHMAVMRWKCSRLNPEELVVLKDWIGKDRKSKNKTKALPWSDEASEYSDELFAENTYIQNAIDNILDTVQLAIEEIERKTGWKAMVFLGGLEPKAGRISSHLYTTGKSRDTTQKFNEVHPEVASVRRLFHDWLRTVYSDEEKQKRSLQGAVTVISMTAPFVDANTDMDTMSDPLTDHPPTDTGSGGASEIPSQTPPPPPPDGPDSNMSLDPSPPNSPPSSRPNTPTPGATFTQPLLMSAGDGVFNLTADCGDFVSEDICAYWESVPGGEKWVEMVKGYLALEAIPSTKGQLKQLPKPSQPQELKTWLKTGKRSLDPVPIITSACTYGTEWIKWWTIAQPQERDTKRWPFSRDAGKNATWRKFPANGKDGIFLAVMALSWWAPAVQSSSDIGLFEEAVSDLHWVIQELTRIKEARQILPPPPPPPQDKPAPRQHDLTPHPPASSSCPPVLSSRLPASSSRPPTSSSRPPTSSSRPPVSSSRPRVPVPSVHTHQRAEGKRVVKPTQKARTQ